MAKKSNAYLLVFGLSVGIGAALYAIKKYTSIFEDLADTLHDKKLQIQIDDLVNEARDSYDTIVNQVSKVTGMPNDGKTKKKESQIASRVDSVKKKVAKTAKKTAATRSRKADSSSRADNLLARMAKGKQYTQKELADMSGIPYRSVRRYIEALVASGSVTEEGYGKGKRFSK